MAFKLFSAFVVLLGASSCVLSAPAAKGNATVGHINTFTFAAADAKSFQDLATKNLPDVIKKVSGTRSEFAGKIDGAVGNNTSIDSSKPQFVIYGTYTDAKERNNDFKETFSQVVANAHNSPVHQNFNIVANKVGSSSLDQNKFGLVVTFNAANDSSIPAVRSFLSGAIPLVNDEKGTVNWIALQFGNSKNFAILDSFPDENSRNAHLNGKVAAALFAQVGKVLDNSQPVIKKTTLFVAGGN